MSFSVSDSLGVAVEVDKGVASDAVALNDRRLAVLSVAIDIALFTPCVIESVGTVLCVFFWRNRTFRKSTELVHTVSAEKIIRIILMVDLCSRKVMRCLSFRALCQ